MQVGPRTVFTWLGHYAMLGIYTLLYYVTKPLRSLAKTFMLRRCALLLYMQHLLPNLP